KSRSKEKENGAENGNGKDYELTFIADRKSAESAAKRALETGVTLAECINLSRDLGNTPGNLMTPADLAKAAASAAKGTKLQVTAWDKTQIKKEKFGGLLGVSLGSAAEPRFIIMKYSGGKK